MPRKKGSGKALSFLLSLLGTTEQKCIDWPFSCGPGGYPNLSIGRTVAAHRYICRLAHGEPPSSTHHAAHTCNRRKCVNPNHVVWKTPKENLDDRKGNGTHPSGERHPLAVLTSAQVREIRLTYQKGKGREMAKKYGVSHSTLCRAAKGTTWTDLTSSN